MTVSTAVEKVRAVWEVGNKAGIPIVINARTDVYMIAGGNFEDKYSEAVRRLAAYRDAGADCVFVPGLKDAATIGRLVDELQCPMNILGVPGAPSVSELQRLRVARLTTGSGAMRAGLGLLRRLVDELATVGSYTTLQDAVPLNEMNALVRRPSVETVS